MEKKAFTIRLPPDLVKELRIQAIKEERRVNELIQEYIERCIYQLPAEKRIYNIKEETK